jgi:hypothetical protein
MMKRRGFLSSLAATAALTKVGVAQAATRVAQPERGRFYTVGHGQTIQDAIDRALLDGANVDERALVLVKPGVYTEELAIYAGVDLDMEEVCLHNQDPLRVHRGASLNMRYCHLDAGIDATADGDGQLSMLRLPARRPSNFE